MAGAAATAPSDGDLLHRVDHAAGCLQPGGLDATVRSYERVSGFDMIFEEYIEVGEQGMQSKVVQSPSGGVPLSPHRSARAEGGAQDPPAAAGGAQQRERRRH